MRPISRLLSLLLIVFTTFSAALAQNARVKRAAPLNWWVGMHNPKLQLMLYGNDLGELTPVINYKGVKIKRVVRVENNNYLFIYLHISHDTKPGTVNIMLKKDGENKITYPYKLKKRRPGSAMREGFNNSDVIYLIMSDRFANGNTKNDNVKGYADKVNRQAASGRHGGDLQGIINHLNYIQKMGFTALWLTPVLQNAMPHGSYHGYAITDFYHVDPRLGSNKLYKELSEKAHKRGIKLIMDMVMNHTGSNYWMLKDPPSSDWYHHQGHYVQTNNIHATIGNPYAAKIDQKQFTHGWFVKSMPDLNQGNPLVADYLIENTLWWIEYAGLRGIREDTYPYVSSAFMKKWSCRVMHEYPNFNIVGEEWSRDPAVVAKWQRGSKLLANFGSCLPSPFGFPLQQSLIQALNGGKNGFMKVYNTLADDYLYPHPFNLTIFAGNHDMDRFYRQVHHKYKLFKMGITFIMTMRGIPEFFYGDEILMSNKEAGNDGQVRSDFPGGWPSDTTNAFTGKGLSSKQKEAQQFVKKLVNWRDKTPVVQHGKLMDYVPQNGLFVYFRYNKHKTVMVIFNKNKQKTALNTGRFYERIGNYSKGTDVLSGKTYSLDDLQISARSALVLVLK